MTLKVFNFCLVLGLLMITMGGMLINPGAGLAVGGFMLICLTMFIARAWGLRSVEPPKTTDQKEKIGWFARLLLKLRGLTSVPE